MSFTDIFSSLSVGEKMIQCLHCCFVAKVRSTNSSGTMWVNRMRDIHHLNFSFSAESEADLSPFLLPYEVRKLSIQHKTASVYKTNLLWKIYAPLTHTHCYLMQAPNLTNLWKTKFNKLSGIEGIKQNQPSTQRCCGQLGILSNKQKWIDQETSCCCRHCQVGCLGVRFVFPK